METKTSCSSDKDQGEIVSTYFGIDLHKDQITWHAILVSSNGTIGRQNGMVPTDRILEDFIPLLSGSKSYAVVEASSSSFFFYGQIASHCEKAIIVNPSAFRELYMTGKKTDRIDARKLADRLKYHIEMGKEDSNFPEVYIPDAEALEVRRLVTMYEMLVKQGTQIKNRLKAVFTAKLISEYENVLEGTLDNVLTDTRLDRADKAIIKTLKNIHDTLQLEKKAIKDEILAIGSKRFRHEVELIIGVSGISSLGAIIFMSDVVTVDRFTSSKRITSYLASVGKVDASGNTIRNGGLNKRGRRSAYRFILQGLEHIVSNNPNFIQFKEHHARTRANKVRAAIVRKTFVTLYYMLKNNEPYRFRDERCYNRKLKEFEKLFSENSLNSSLIEAYTDCSYRESIFCSIMRI